MPQDVIQSLNDLELAILVCLIANEHCIIRADESALGDLQTELENVCKNTFGLPSTALHCDAKTTLEGFAEAVINNETLMESQRHVCFAPTS